MRPAFAGVAAVALLACAGAAQAADLGGPARADDDPFAPATPLGVAAELPRSPLADVTVFGTERFATPAAAAAHCPADEVVQIDPLSAAMHPARPPGPGAFMCRSAAFSEGDRSR